MSDDLRSRRRHGDCFPLLRQALLEKLAEDGHGCSQRAGWLVDALNKLALHDTFVNSQSSRVLSSSPSLTKTQHAVANRIAESFELYGADVEAQSPEEALKGLCGGKPAYDGIPSNLASYSEEKLKILKSKVQPRHIRDFLPVEAKKLLQHADKHIVKDKAEVETGFSPYWDPVLRNNPKERLRFILKLFESGLLTLRPKATATVGVFFVKKKTPDFFRMVIDCRGSNQLHQPPPVTRLASSRCYSDLMVEQQEDRPPAWGRECDVNDCFYRFAVPELSHFFAINHPLTAQQWKDLGICSERVFDPDAGCNVKTHSEQLLYPCFQAVPMGWSWALFLCNEAVVSIASKHAGWCDGLIREKRVVPQLDEHRTLLGVYVDNITVLGRSEDDVNERCKSLDHAFAEAGIPITWSQSQAVTALESVGCWLDFNKGVIMNKPSRVWRFAKATQALLRRRKLKGHTLQIWTGHYTALCGLTPWGLAALQHVYRFIETAGEKRLHVWPSVRKELKIAGSLVWMTWRQLTATPMKVVEAGDSSSSGFAMTACYPEVSLTREAMRTHERWRFIAMPDELKKHATAHDIDAFQDALRGLLVTGDRAPLSDAPKKMHDERIFRAAGVNTGYAKTVVDAMKEGSLLKTSAVRSQVRAKPRARVDIEVPALVQPLDKFFADEQNFRLLWAKRWKRADEHITLKEMRVCLSSLRRASRVTELHGYRKLTLCDNLAVVSAFSKGRATNGAMNTLCKQSCALQFCTGIVWSVRHIESGRNPADRPSRFYEKRGRALGSEPVQGVNYFGGGSHSGACSSSKPKCSDSGYTAPQVFPRGHGKFFLELFSGAPLLTGSIM